MTMTKEEALKILDFDRDANPQKWELEERGMEKTEEFGGKNENLEELCKKFERMKTAESLLLRQFFGPDSKPFRYVDLDDDAISLSGFEFRLYSAIVDNDVEYLKKVFSKFKSSKDGPFGDYINKPHSSINWTPLRYAVFS